MARPALAGSASSVPAPRRRKLNSLDLIETARGLATLTPRRAGQAEANFRRAISTAYYAMFHCLAGVAANLFIGRKRSPAWHRVHRALEHGKIRVACQNKKAMAGFGFPPEIHYFAEIFVELQEMRQQADYALDDNPEDPYYETRVLGFIASAEFAIEQFEQVDVQHRRDFVAHVLFKSRQ